MDRVIDNPRTGERIVIHQSDPEVLVFDVFLQPGGHVPAGHLHPNQEERFTVLDGQVRFRVGKQRLTLIPGDTVRVPEGTSHWFGNASSHAAQVRVEVRPALRMEELFETSATRSRWTELALVLLDFRQEVRAPFIPAGVTTLLAWVRSLLSR